MVYGVYYGYSDEAIAAFCKRCFNFDKGIVLDVSAKIKASAFYTQYSGFVPTEQEADCFASEVVAQINARRFCSLPFSFDRSQDLSMRDTKKEVEAMKKSEEHAKRVVVLYDRINRDLETHAVQVCEVFE